jgi:hypothetical protein
MSKYREMSSELRMDFQKWYKTYPRKIGRRAAEQAWANCVTRNSDFKPAYFKTLLIMRSEKYAQKVIQDETEEKWIPHPATWLNQDRWDDDALRIAVEEGEGDLAPTTL